MEVNLGKTPFDLDFHPSDSLVAAGLVNGGFRLYRYSEDTAPERMLAIRAHREGCRAVRFVNAGRTILTASSDHSIATLDVETRKIVSREKEAHQDAVNRLVNLSETTIASGGDEGTIKVWDTRQLVSCHSFDAHTEFISDIIYSPSSFQLIGTSGDGTLSVCDLRKNKVQAHSEFSEDELLSVVIMKNGRKVICGTQTGALLLYSWNYFKDCSDRFLGHPMSVDTLLKLDEDTLISGSSDGVIRLVGILPNKIVQPIAEHADYPIERLAFSSDGKYLGSISHDQMLKIWNLEELLEGKRDVSSTREEDEDDSEDEDGDDHMDVDGKPKRSSKGSPRRKADRGNGLTIANADFFADL